MISGKALRSFSLFLFLMLVLPPLIKSTHKLVYTNEDSERKKKWETYKNASEVKRRKKEIKYIQVNKELQRVSRDTLKKLDSKDIMLVFPPMSSRTTTVQVLKDPMYKRAIA